MTETINSPFVCCERNGDEIELQCSIVQSEETLTGYAFRFRALSITSELLAEKEIEMLPNKESLLSGIASQHLNRSLFGMLFLDYTEPKAPTIRDFFSKVQSSGFSAAYLNAA